MIGPLSRWQTGFEIQTGKDCYHLNLNCRMKSADNSMSSDEESSAGVIGNEASQEYEDFKPPAAEVVPPRIEMSTPAQT